MEKFEKKKKNQLFFVKGFDELYSEVCSRLRKDEKIIDLGEKLRNASSDLNRIQFLITNYPFILKKFRNEIKENYEEKNIFKSNEYFLHSIQTTTQVIDAIDDLNNAILLHPYSHHCITATVSSSPTTTTTTPNTIITSTFSTSSAGDEGLRMTEICLNEETLNWFLNIEINNVVDNEQHIILKKQSSGRGMTEMNEYNDTKLLSKIYMERSRRFQETKEHDSCILDIYLAIYYGHEKTYDLVYMVAVNYKALGYKYYSSAKLIFQHYLQLLRLSSFNNETKSVQTLKVVKELKDIKLKSTVEDSEERNMNSNSSQEKRITMTKTMTSSPAVNRLLDVMEFYDGPSSPLIGACHALELRYTLELGRHVVAKTMIPAGTTLIVDTPYSWSLCPRMYKSFCQHCCRKIQTRSWISCQQCSSVVFCGLECRRKSEHYHKFECRILKLLDSSETLGEMGLLTYRTIAKTPLSILLTQFTNQLDDKMDSTTKNISLSLSSPLILMV